MMIRMRISPRSVCAFFFMIGVINLPCYDYFGKLEIVNNITRIIAALIIAYIYVIRSSVEEIKVSKCIFCILLIQIWTIFSTIINQGAIWYSLVNTASVISILLFMELYKGNEKILINVLMILGELLCYGNLISIYLFPNGLYESELYWQNWILGNRNLFTAYLIVFCLVAYIYRGNGGGKFREWGIYIGSFMNVFLVKSTTSIIGFALMILLILISRVWKKTFKVPIFVWINFTAFVAIVVFRIQNIFSVFIENILRKTLSFTGRTDLWDTVIQFVKESPFIGYGIQDTVVTTTRLGFNWASHAHNMFLQQLYTGGIPQFLLYIYLIYLSYKALNYYSDKFQIQGCAIILFVFLIMCLMEVYSSSFIFLLYYLLFNIHNFMGKEEMKLLR